MQIPQGKPFALISTPAQREQLGTGWPEAGRLDARTTPELLTYKMMLWVAFDRTSVYDKTKSYLDKAITIFEGVMSFSNHLGMFSEEIAINSERLGNTPQPSGFRQCGVQPKPGY